MIVDAHVQFWKYTKGKDAWISNDRKALQEDYLPEQLTLTEKWNDITGLVAVQARNMEVETRFLVEIAQTHPIVKGVVGWVDLAAPDVKEKLQEFSRFPVIKGWRHSGENGSDDFLLNADFQRGVGELQAFNYTYDILVHNRQWSAAASLVSKFPQQKFVLDHCGNPDISHAGIDEWRFWISELAKYPNVCCKVSGLFTVAPWKRWSPGDFYPYLDVVFDAFGIDRLLFASDWPTILLSGMYVQWKSLVEKYMENFSAEQKEKVFGLNAVQFYGL